ncbi:hypothetical protein ACFL0F_00595, partial [Patescibacteria group bacterium]
MDNSETIKKPDHLEVVVISKTEKALKENRPVMFDLDDIGILRQSLDETGYNFELRQSVIDRLTCKEVVGDEES